MIPELLKCRDLATVLGVSFEPLLSELNAEPIMQYEPLHEHYKMTFGFNEWRGIDWAIIGGESGPNHRTVPYSAIRSIWQQCRDAGVPVFVKQDAGPKPGMQGRIEDEVWASKEFPKLR
jgi:protein gp37